MSLTQATLSIIVPETTVAKPPSKTIAVQTSANEVDAKKVVKTRVKKASAPVAKLATEKNIKSKPVTVARAAKTAPKPDAEASAVPVAKASTEKLIKDKSLKLMRDGFTIPKGEYLVFDQLKLRGGKLGRAVKKSELIRAGIKALLLMSDANFLAAVTAVPSIKIGRPAKK